MRFIYESEMFARNAIQQRGEKEFSLTKGLLLKRTVRRLAEKPKISEMEISSPQFQCEECLQKWPVCTHATLTPMELSCFVFRASESSYVITEDYFYGEETRDEQVMDRHREQSIPGSRSSSEEGFRGGRYQGLLVYR